MLISAKEMRRFSVHAADGADVGAVEDLYFDDASWGVRYLVVRAGGLFANRMVLVGPESVAGIDGSARRLRLALTKERAEDAPGIEADRPVADQRELDHRERTGEGAHRGSGWEDATSPSPAPPPAQPGAGPEKEPGAGGRRAVSGGDPHLRSAKRVGGYRLSATDGELGHVEDFIVDEEGWEIRYLVVDTRDWLPGREVVLPSARIEEVSWADGRVYADLTRAEVESAPEWDGDAAADPGYEARLHEHYRPAPRGHRDRPADRRREGPVGRR